MQRKETSLTLFKPSDAPEKNLRENIDWVLKRAKDLGQEQANPKLNFIDSEFKKYTVLGKDDEITNILKSIDKAKELSASKIEIFNAAYLTRKLKSEIYSCLFTLDLMKEMKENGQKAEFELIQHVFESLSDEASILNMARKDPAELFFIFHQINPVINVLALEAKEKIIANYAQKALQDILEITQVLNHQTQHAKEKVVATEVKKTPGL